MTEFRPVAITGMHRSGTSMITRGLHESGLHLIGGDADQLLAAADDNPEGFWENKAIVACNDDLLEAAGGAWDNPPAVLPHAVDDPRFAEIVEPATAALAGLAENDRWGFKDPRLCLTAPFWIDLQPDLRFVLCVRNPLEVALSLKRRNQNSYSLGLSLWERYYRAALDAIPEERRIVTHYDAYFLDPAGELGRVCEFLGLEPATLDVRTDLRHHDVGVSLDEANASAGLRDLYTELCDQAGIAPPRPVAVDEGRVRRLILDGTVSARHAEQRQTAIARLEERIAEAQDIQRNLRDELAEVRRESEARRRELVDRQRDLSKRDAQIVELRDRVSAADGEIANLRDGVVSRLDSLGEETRRVHDLTDAVADLAHQAAESSKRLDDRQQVANDRLAHIDDILGAVHVKLRAVEDDVRSNRSFGQRLRSRVGGIARRVLGPSRKVAGAGARQTAPVVKRGARATARRLPQPVKHNVHRVRRAVADGQAGNRVRERGARAVDKLPAPAQKAARRGVAAANKAGVVPKARRVAKGVVRRLPARAQRMVGKAVSAPAPARRPARPAKKAAAPPRPKQTADGRAATVPKGPSSFKWQKSYERLVADCVPEGSTFAVATPGCKDGIAKVGARQGVAFPAAEGAPPADAQALVAVVEALRASSVERLVVPEGSRAWVESHPELRDHLAAHAVVVDDRAGAGVVLDLTELPDRAHQSLLGTVHALSADLDELPAVLDWTHDDVAADLPGFTTFSPPDSDALPYAARSVDIVVTAADRDLLAADRVASVGVVVVDGDHRPVEVRRIDATEADDASVVIVDPDASPATAVCAGAAGARVVADPADVDGARCVIVVEPGMVPLPGSIEALTAAVTANPDRLAVAKVIGPDGRLVSAGGTVFADGETSGIAAGSLEVRAPWHEFVRPVCWGRGMVAVAGDRWDADRWSASGGSFVEFCGAAWQAGLGVAYQPRAVVVAIDDAAPDTPATGYWADRATTRPRRPQSLADGAWRYLIANEPLRPTPEAST